MAGRRQLSHAVEDQDQPWDRMAKEPEKAFAAFCVYRDSKPGDRSLRQLAQALNIRGVKRLALWSKKWQWQERVHAYDTYLDKLHRDKNEDELAVRIGHWKKVARLVQEIAETDLKMIRAHQGRNMKNAQEARKKEPDALPAPVLNAREARMFLERGVALERLILGEPSEIAGESGPSYDMSKLSKEDLKALKQLRDKASGKDRKP